nr:ATP-binding protein [uncultured Acetatifactor sp.]
MDLIENEEYGYCSLIKATNNVLEKMKIENTTKAKVTNTKRVEKNLVEPVPMREALINAVVHNDFTREIPPVFEIFSDRLELTSYGGLIPGQSRKEFFSCSSMPRNRELMRVFKDVGLVEQLGSGMSRILRYYDKSIFEISEHFIKVIFLFSLLDEGENIANGDNNGDNMCSHERLSRDVELVLEMLKKMPSITATEMSEQTGFSTRKISRIMRELRERGRIVRIGSTRKGYWKLKK